MTKPELADERPYHMGRHFARVMGWSLLFSFALIGGVAAYAGGRTMLRGEVGEGLPWVLAGVILLALFGWLSWRYRPDFTMGEPHTPRGNRMRWAMAGIVAVSVAVGMATAMVAGPDKPYILFSNAPLPKTLIWPLLLIWVVLLPPLFVFSLRNLDDFGRQAHDFGMMMGMQLIAFATPTWWLAWRGGLLPRPDAMVLFLAALAVANIAILWKRARG
ncbi:hypothetical protein MKP08_10530 [Erythrobacter sp. LQ02-29]|uniref:hypothetical protein n=1 Tax=Erythrobacter sp. LQ02-29 TaxID=2920384 RepID=UPI001F4E0A00|nr:hypothetical protein [Erythrobacter sp. LQ02-29]MCP9223185.1 hypothetical protein [Erythrobacter sp. LQ02-29]